MHPTLAIAVLGLSAAVSATRATSASCVFNGELTTKQSDGGDFTVDFFGVTPDEPDYQNCELGFLDNLRGQCLGIVDQWACDNVNGVLKTSGNVPAGWRGCVENAIYLSQNGLEGVTCAKP